MKPLLLIAALVALTGCAQFRTRQTDVSYENGKIVREVTTKASQERWLAGWEGQW